MYTGDKEYGKGGGKEGRTTRFCLVKDILNLRTGRLEIPQESLDAVGHPAGIRPVARNTTKSSRRMLADICIVVEGILQAVAVLCTGIGARVNGGRCWGIENDVGPRQIIPILTLGQAAIVD